ncbi:probable glycosyltransferase At5g03795 [Hibiscus syriacus]|uniref:probable glycosyltransferase At5g03795 n=1 Tax=Hibiscus syriacus TaxID=106335 RepID=UPI0019205520|nr:probable glycosyltransferase At5g03795 [Hibiscus syriacus]
MIHIGLMVQNERKEDGLNITLNPAGNASTISQNESIGLPLKQSKQVQTELDKVEAGLQRARSAIKEAKGGSQLQDPDYIPTEAMYWDSMAFHRYLYLFTSLLFALNLLEIITKSGYKIIIKKDIRFYEHQEMEKQFKVFLYKEGEPPVFHDGPCKSIYSMEGNFIYQMDVDSKFQTNDPHKAHVFYLPFSVAKMVRFVFPRDTCDFSPVRRTVVAYINLVAQKYPFWNRNHGANYFIVACHDWGPLASFSLPYLVWNSIQALCNANTSERLKPVKDVSIPEINLLNDKLTGLIGGPSASQRSILAFFAGGVQGPIRPVLLEHWEGKDEDIKVHKYLLKGVNYHDMMRNSKYCICSSGYEVASPRIVETLYNGFVPVLISKSYVPPPFSVVVSVEENPRQEPLMLP